MAKFCEVPMSVTKIIIALMTFSLGTLAMAECVKEGGWVGVYPNAPRCCEGLELKRPTDGRVGTAGQCVAKIQTNCVKKGDSVVLYPGAPKCCEGLVLKRPVDGRLGVAGTCVEKKDQVSEKMDDSDRSIQKDPAVKEIKIFNIRTKHQ